MYYLLLLTFLSLIFYIAIGDSVLNKVTFKTNPKYRKHVLDAIVCFLGGILFSISTQMFVADYFRLGEDFLNADMWRIDRARNFWPFIFGYIITYIIIFVKRAYRK
jgi:hypothetical protein